jgi:hypothetical protein
MSLHKKLIKLFKLAEGEKGNDEVEEWEEALLLING